MVPRSRIASINPWHVADTFRITEQDVFFHNKGARLSGTAYLPPKGRRIPGLVALHGASAPSRSSGLYDHLRKELPRMGIGVLVFDRRGTGKSTGDSRRVDYRTLADDAVAGQKALGKLAPVDPGRVGFWGLSQGGWLAVLATSRSERPAFAISVSAPLTTPERQMEFATSNLLDVRGFSRNDVRRMLHARKAWLDYLSGRTSFTSAGKQIRAVEREPWFKLAFIPKLGELESSRGALVELYYDPLSALHSVRVPLLFIYGAEDPWIPVEESIKLTRKIARNKANVSYTLIPGANHEMMFSRKENMVFEEKKLKEIRPDAPGYFIQMSMWLSRHVISRNLLLKN